MAGTKKHNSKYKKPKDFEASQTKAFIKKEVRKSLKKDYMIDDKDGGQNPYSKKGTIQTDVLRKRDKESEESTNMVPKKTKHMYKLDGNHDPKHTAKIKSEYQKDDEKMSKEEIEDKIENLTREGKEEFVRKYIRKKVQQILLEKQNNRFNLINEAPPAPEVDAPEAPPPPEDEEPEVDAPEVDEPETGEEETGEEETGEEETGEEEDTTFKSPAEQKYFEWVSMQPSTTKKIESILSILHKTLDPIKNTDEKKAVTVNFNKGIENLRKMLNIPLDSIKIDSY